MSNDTPGLAGSWHQTYGDLPTDDDLAKVDLADGDAEVAPGVSMRQMAKEVYRCADDSEAERMLRRILAS